MQTAQPFAKMLILLGLWLSLVEGCTSKQEDLSLVHGQVSHHGKPLASGTIVFTPDASRGSQGVLAQGQIQADGRYHLRCEDGPGVHAGWYRVTVMSVSMPSQIAAGERYATPQSLVPEKYRDPDLAGLVRRVQRGENNIDIDLE